MEINLVYRTVNYSYLTKGASLHKHYKETIRFKFFKWYSHSIIILWKQF